MPVLSRETKEKKDAGFVLFFLRYVLMALVMTVAVFVLLGIFYIFVDIPAKALGITTLVVSVLVSLVVSFIVGKDTAAPVTGGCVVLMFALLRCILSIVFGFTSVLSLRTPFELITGFLIGLIGGILGSSGGNRRRRRYR